MAKIDYSQVELILTKTLKNMFLQNLENLAILAFEIQAGTVSLKEEEIDFILKEFRIELKKIKNMDPKFYEQLLITSEEEENLLSLEKNFNSVNWTRIIELRDRLKQITTERPKSNETNTTTPEDEERIEKERREHKNKRFNVRKGWLPLH